MTDPSAGAQEHWEERWRDTVWEARVGDAWQALPPCSATALVVITAWNPQGSLLPLAVNRARDAVLAAELQARALGARRARGRSPDGAWCEEGWLLAHDPALTTLLLRRYDQLAGRVSMPGGAYHHWAG